MAYHYLKATFSRAEVSPLVHAREDIELYKSGAEYVRNFFVLREGGLRRRSGTKYRGAAKLPETNARLIPFIFNAEQSYALEFGDEYLRFWTKDGQVLDVSDAIYEIVSPYAEDQVDRIQFAQANDAMYIAFPSLTIKPKRLLRNAHDDWEFVDVDFLDGPYLPINDQQNILSTSAALVSDTTVTFTWTNALGINGGTGLVATDVGRAVRCQFKGKWSWGTITTVTDEKTADVLIVDGQGGGGAGTDTGDLGGFNGGNEGSNNSNEFQSLSWRLGAFSDTTGYPGSVAFYQGRIFWGRTDANPRSVAYSRSGLLDTYTPSDVDGTVTDSHGGFYDITAGRADEIKWLAEAPRLQIGSASAIRTLGSSGTEEVMTPRNVTQRLEDNTGVSGVVPTQVGPSNIFVGRFGYKLHDLFYDYNANSLVTPELSSASNHLFEGGIKGSCFQQEPYALLWTWTIEGELRSTTVDRYEKVIGFCGHEFTNGFVVSACSIPGQYQDDLWLLMRREINGSTVTYVETLERPFRRQVKADAYFVDCGATYVSGSGPVGTVTGITWLEGETVSILADGNVLPDTVITGGQLVLPNSRMAEKIHFGLPITAYVQTLRAPVPGQDGPLLGRRRRVVSVTADVFETLGLRVGVPDGLPETLTLRKGTDAMGSSPPLYTGTEKKVVEDTFEGDAKVYLECSQPLPATIRALLVQIDAEGM